MTSENTVGEAFADNLVSTGAGEIVSQSTRAFARSALMAQTQAATREAVSAYLSSIDIPASRINAIDDVLKNADYSRISPRTAAETAKAAKRVGQLSGTVASGLVSSIIGAADLEVAYENNTPIRAPPVQECRRDRSLHVGSGNALPVQKNGF